MDLKERFDDYEAQCRTIYAQKPKLLRKWLGHEDKRALVAEYCALVEEICACSYDKDRSAYEAGRAEGETKAEYERMNERMSARIDEILPRVAELKEAIGA